MKGIDIFCASQASTAISLSMEEPSSSSSSTILLAGGRAIDRHNPIIRDSRRIARSLPPCTTPQSPISPKPHKKKKSHKIPLNENYTEIKKSAEIANSNKPDEETKKKKKDTGETNRDGGVAGKNGVTVRKSSWSCTKPGGFISPPGSTRYLLGDKVLLNAVSDFDPNLKLFPEGNSEPVVSKVVQAEEPLDGKLSSASVSPDEVVEPREVVLRVSLHCRGCERKMRKHISRMEGVTSFDIDFMAKKVTVTGNVTPLSVLSSISKVKNAQLWPPTVASSTPSVNLNDSGLIKNEGKGGDANVGDNKEGIFVSMASQI